ncbi:hypothetical protein PUR29_35215 [Methylobacterium ajmalii]|uniref:Uncharacterized protein n=1 Tax=Methylobacterium ajmalii TaxID=2738439 RepID=A0ABV0A7K4_9HYPH
MDLFSNLNFDEMNEKLYYQIYLYARRASWRPGKELFVALNEEKDTVLRVSYLTFPSGAYYPSDEDMKATDWVVY